MGQTLIRIPDEVMLVRHVTRSRPTSFGGRFLLLATGVVGLVAVMAIGVPSVAARSFGGGAAKADCSYLTKRGTAINQAQLVWTKLAYSDGTITPDEQKTAGWYTAEIAAVTKALAACIGGVKAPDLSGVTFSGTTWSTAGGQSVKIRWTTDKPASVEIIFQHYVAGQQLEVGAIKVAANHRSVTFSGKAGSVKIVPGKYLVTLVATGAKGAESKPISKQLTVLP